MWYQNTAPTTREKAGRAALSAHYLVSARRFPARYGVEKAKATVFEGDCPAAPIIRCMNFPIGYPVPISLEQVRRELCPRGISDRPTGDTA